MVATMLRHDVSIDQHVYVHLIRDVFSRSPLFRDAAVSEPLRTPEGDVALNVGFGDGPTVFRVVAGSGDEAYAILHELALAMVEVEQGLGGGRKEWQGARAAD
jgi:hypothetical protein